MTVGARLTATSKVLDTAPLADSHIQVWQWHKTILCKAFRVALTLAEQRHINRARGLATAHILAFRRHNRKKDVRLAVGQVFAAARYKPQPRVRFPSAEKALADLSAVSTKVAALRRALESGHRLDRRLGPKTAALTRAVRALQPATRLEVHGALLADRSEVVTLREELIAIDRAIGVARKLIAINGHLHAKPATLPEHVAQSVADWFQFLAGRPAAHSKDPYAEKCRVEGPYHNLLTAAFEAQGLKASAEHEGHKVTSARQLTEHMVKNRQNGSPISTGSDLRMIAAIATEMHGVPDDDRSREPPQAQEAASRHP